MIDSSRNVYISLYDDVTIRKYIDISENSMESFHPRLYFFNHKEWIFFPEYIRTTSQRNERTFLFEFKKSKIDPFVNNVTGIIHFILKYLNQYEYIKR